MPKIAFESHWPQLYALTSSLEQNRLDWEAVPPVCFCEKWPMGVPRVEASARGRLFAVLAWLGGQRAPNRFLNRATDPALRRVVGSSWSPPVVASSAPYTLGEGNPGAPDIFLPVLLPAALNSPAAPATAYCAGFLLTDPPP